MRLEALSGKHTDRARPPRWLVKRYIDSPENLKVRSALTAGKINTVCQEARCPNINECFSEKKVTFIILGNACTRSCGFCAVRKGPLAAPDPGEGDNILKVIQELDMRYVILTSVTRDDLADGGLGHYLDIIKKIKESGEKRIIEALVPDFKDVKGAAASLAASGIDVLAHNIETVKSLYHDVRPGADYTRSLDLLLGVKRRARRRIYTKSGFMLGLGEKEQDVLMLLSDLKDASCDIVTIGQYLKAHEKCLPVRGYAEPEIFRHYERAARDLGIKYVLGAPFARSSYKAEEIYRNIEGCNAG